MLQIIKQKESMLKMGSIDIIIQYMLFCLPTNQ